MNRGARRAEIFRDDNDRRLFLAVLSEVPARFGARIHGYALMPNHFHLMLESVRGNLSRVMQFVGAQFSIRLNEREGWDGPVFRGRFRNQLVTDDAYWQHLLVYLHLNPVRAGLLAEPSAGPWTSHEAYVGRRAAPDWLTMAELLKLVGGRSAYRDLIARTVRSEVRSPVDPSKLWQVPFTTALEEKPRPRLLAPPGADDDPEWERVVEEAVTRAAALLQAPPAVPRRDAISRRGVRRARRGFASSTEQPVATRMTLVEALKRLERTIGFSHLAPRDDRSAPALAERQLAAWWLKRATGLGADAVARALSSTPREVRHWIRWMDEAVSPGGPRLPRTLARPQTSAEESLPPDESG